MKHCEGCDRDITLEGARYCPWCGHGLHVAERCCPTCGYEMQADFSFCPICGVSSQNTPYEAPLAKKPIKENADELSIYHWLDFSEENIFEDYTVCKNDSFSYCIRSERANDLRIKKKFSVLPDTVYYITADIRTENVLNHENQENPVGACISTNDWYFSRSLFATNDWQTVGVLGRSDDYGNLWVSFNLGYSFNTCSGNAWFENVCFTPADTITGNDSTWKILAVLLTESGIDTADEQTGERIRLSHKMSREELILIRKSLLAFEEDFNNDAEGLLSAKVEIFEPTVSCKSYTKFSLGYTISGPSARAYLESLGVDILSYDHVIFIACQPKLPASYFGLGGLPIKEQVGYSFILFADMESSLRYLRGELENSWIPAIYMHEFLHSIERCANSLRLPVPLVDGDRFGYSDVEEYRAWYRDFMHKRLLVNGDMLGVDPRVWKLRPSLFR